eukprot:7378810-Prymnesium_polylepis.2
MRDGTSLTPYARSSGAGGGFLNKSRGRPKLVGADRGALTALTARQKCLFLAFQRGPEGGVKSGVNKVITDQPRRQDCRQGPSGDRTCTGCIPGLQFRPGQNS